MLVRGTNHTWPRASPPAMPLMGKPLVFIEYVDAQGSSELEARLSALGYEVAGNVAQVHAAEADLVLMNLLPGVAADESQAADAVRRHHPTPVVFVVASEE